MSVELLEAHDNFADLRKKIGMLAQIRDEWAGIPMPLEDCNLVVEPKFPRAAELMAAFNKPRELRDWQQRAKYRNSFWSTFRRCTIAVIELDGEISYAFSPGVHSLDFQLQTLGASCAWGIEQEANAVKLLGTLLPHRAFKHYMLTGAFLESSARSGLTYMFRRLRPTVVISSRDVHGTPGATLRILCTLCLHPIAYYSESWAGAMTPTDDVVAHLMLMRGDEPMLWRRANQHPAHRPESGL